MEKKLLSIFILISCNVFAQYHGGINDGLSRVFSLSQNLPSNIYKRGFDDGFANTTVSNQNMVNNIFKGG